MNKDEKFVLTFFIEALNQHYEDLLSESEINILKPEEIDFYFGSVAGFYDSLYTIENILKNAGYSSKDFADKITPDLKLLVPKNNKTS